MILCGTWRDEILKKEIFCFRHMTRYIVFIMMSDVSPLFSSVEIWKLSQGKGPFSQKGQKFLVQIPLPQHQPGLEHL